MSETPKATAAHLGNLIAACRANPDVHDAYKAALRAYLSAPQDQSVQGALELASDERDALIGPLDALLRETIDEALRNASAAGTLRAVAGPEGNTAFEDRWVDVVEKGWDGAPDYVREQICEALGNALRHHFIEANLPSDIACEEIAATLLGIIESGTLPEPIPGGEMFTNFSDGANLHFTMEDFTPSLFVLDEDGARIPPAQMPRGKIFHAEIDFPTGKLLVADEISIGSIHDQRMHLLRKLGLRVNYAWHRIVWTACSTRRIGAVDVACAKDGPSLVVEKDTGRLHIARPDAHRNPLASICRDYWGAMLIDRANVMALLMAGGMTSARAEKAIAKWLASSPHRSEITVKPGTWHLYWDDDRESMAGASCDGRRLPAECQMTLSPTELSLDVPVIDMSPTAEKFAPQAA